MLYIFDWDGTVCDSTGKIIACMQKAAGDLDLPVLKDDTIKNIIGLGLPEALATLYPAVHSKHHADIKERYSHHFLQTTETRADLFTGAMETLQSLKRQGYKLAVATGKSRQGLDRILKSMELGDFFDVTRCADETRSKPHPLMLHEVLEEACVLLGDAVMIGDTEYDMAMATAAGMRKIGVSYGAHHKDRLLKHRLDLCIDEFNEILNWRF